MLNKFYYSLSYVTFLSLIFTAKVFGAEADPGAKIEEGLNQVQGFLTGIIVIVGICAGVWIVLNKLPGRSEERRVVTVCTLVLGQTITIKRCSRHIQAEL